MPKTPSYRTDAKLRKMPLANPRSSDRAKHVHLRGPSAPELRNDRPPAGPSWYASVVPYSGAPQPSVNATIYPPGKGNIKPS